LAEKLVLPFGSRSLSAGIRKLTRHGNETIRGSAHLHVGLLLGGFGSLDTVVSSLSASANKVTHCLHGYTDRCVTHRRPTVSLNHLWLYATLKTGVAAEKLIGYTREPRKLKLLGPHRTCVPRNAFIGSHDLDGEYTATETLTHQLPIRAFIHPTLDAGTRDVLAANGNEPG
jgi:hypothetical protein